MITQNMNTLNYIAFRPGWPDLTVAFAVVKDILGPVIRVEYQMNDPEEIPGLHEDVIPHLGRWFTLLPQVKKMRGGKITEIRMVNMPHNQYLLVSYRVPEGTHYNDRMEKLIIQNGAAVATYRVDRGGGDLLPTKIRKQVQPWLDMLEADHAE